MLTIFSVTCVEMGCPRFSAAYYIQTDTREYGRERKKVAGYFQGFVLGCPLYLARQELSHSPYHPVLQLWDREIIQLKSGIRLEKDAVIEFHKVSKSTLYVSASRP